MAQTTWTHPSPFANDDRESLAFLREARADSIKQIAKFERMAAEAASRVGGFVAAARLREWANAERGCLVDLESRIAARRSR